MRNTKVIAHITVRCIWRRSILVTVTSQSSTSMGLSPSVMRVILRVHDFLETRYLLCVSMPTIRASIAKFKSVIFHAELAEDFAIRSPKTVEGARASILAMVAAFGCAMGMYSITFSYAPFSSLTTFLVSNTRISKKIEPRGRTVPSEPKTITPHWSVFLPLNIWVGVSMMGGIYREH